MIKEIFKSKQVSLLILCLFLVYGFHFIIRVFATQNFGDSDGVEALMLDTLKIGYSSSGGPLYTWLLHFVVAGIGFNVASFLLLKYLLVALIYYIFYSLYLVFSSNKKWALVASLSLGSCYFMIWRLHEVMTQRLLTVFLGVLIVFYYFHCMRAKIGYLQSAILGLFIGLGLLTEVYVYVVIAALVLVSFFQGNEWSGVKVIFAILVGALISMPFYSWLITTDQFWQYILGAREFATVDYDYKVALHSAVLHPLYVISPAVMLYVPFLLSKKTVPAATDASCLHDGLLKRYLLLCYGLWIILFVFVSPLKNNEVQAALPVFLPCLILLFLSLENRAVSMVKLILVLCLFPIVSIVFRVGNLLVHEPFCRNCRWAIPYEGLANTIEDCVRPDQKLTVYSHSADILANLKRYHGKNIYIQLSQSEINPEVSSDGHYLIIEDIAVHRMDSVSDSNQKSVVIKWKQPYLNFFDGRVRYSTWQIEFGQKVDRACVKDINQPF